MSWKSYAAVSGATVLAGWLASTPPSTPDSAAAVTRQPTVRTPAPSDIEREAERLQLRVRHEIEYAQPRRNPFRFGERQADVNGSGDTLHAPPVSAPPVFVAPVPQVPPLKLAGIAEDQNGAQVERTAILSSPAGVLLVREGESVAGEFRVERIESEAVDLVKDDGTTLRLMLSR